ncbi:hypothetical protein UA08_09511 [Talaromyces atroroseus]|uniref:Protein kinase domain-containing protein n=1 Tax=Talaromyces atroroseus TaxID=1441469 RepID=A0A1Q5Q5Y1_TALAT|nr:hypothetical protein UA08_09511 [Talaromyces atroroseus]OKL55216.1 hypothetical protein UA08_09511 [Talaromyces atroroseus]
MPEETFSRFPAIRPRTLIPEDDDPRRPEIIPIESQNFPGPGMLAVTVHRGMGLSVPQFEAVSKQSERRRSNRWSMPYTILECDGSEVSISAFDGTKESPNWRPTGKKTFDIFRATQLTIRLYARNPNSWYNERSQDVFIGSAKMNLALGDDDSHQMEWLTIENGTGKLLVESEYSKNKSLQIQVWEESHSIGHSRFKSVYKLKKDSTKRFYASTTIQKDTILSHSPDILRSLPLSPINNIPFIAPLKFIAQTRSYISLYWPFISGGHLFYHLQQALLFEEDRARLYAAEMLIALEQLHEVDPSYHELKPKNILLDSVGHVVLCDLGFLHLETSDMEKTIDVTLDYQAPELLSRKGILSTETSTSASKWWTLGSFLFEMLTGLPPFYDEDAEQRHHNILSEQPLEKSKYLSESAHDLLNKLLSRKPEDRLGVRHGAAEIKAHRFFDDLDWDKVAQREYEPAFKPHKCEMVFSQEKYPPQTTWEDIVAAWNYNNPPSENAPPSIKGLTVVESHEGSTEQKAAEQKDDWELIWQRQSQKFHFYNRSTKTEKPINSNREKQSQNRSSKARSKKRQGIATNFNANNVDTSSPDAAQCQEAFEAVLENQYMHLLPKLLKEYSINLDIELKFARTTPIHYVTKLGDVETVRLFLENGADANQDHSCVLGGQTLLTAVKKGNQELTEILVQRTDRVPRTRALAHAVSKNDLPIINTLLANGAKCDFEDSDRPQGPGACVDGLEWELDATIEDISEPDEYIPPLVRAILFGDVDLVQLLLDHGADPNIGYHDLSNFEPGFTFMDMSERFYMCCGRPIQVAMELGYRDKVQVLLSYGADIDLPQPVWQHHDCKMIPREMHHKIIARLRSEAGSVAA